MRKNITRVLAVLVLVVFGLLLPACESMDGYSTTYVGVGYAPYGGYYGHGWGGCCYGGAVGGVVVGPPIYGGAYGGYR